VLELGIEHTRRSRGEPGCLSHDVYANAEEPMRIFFFETWADREAVAAHFAVPASLAFVKAAGELAEGAPSIQIYDAELMSSGRTGGDSR
jgi:quinol monooxygenase YgiN